jgi:peptidoglycan/LPS O-acetylase OafA/YrhL
VRGVGGFFTNRVLRIYPALVACVALSVVAVALTGYFREQQVAPARVALWIACQMSFFQFYNPAFMRAFGVGVLNGALWTITVELQFYLLVPLMYYLLRRWPRVLLAAALVSLGVNLYFREAMDWEPLYEKLLYVSFVPWVYMFLLGFFAASSQRVRALAAALKVRYLAPAYVVSMLAVGAYSLNASNGINPLSFTLLGLLIMRVAESRLWIPRILSSFVAKNDLSYGLYLYHMPLINLLLVMGRLAPTANTLNLVVLSFVAATLSWYAVEKPALSHKR